MTRQHVDLCGPWKFQPAPVGFGEKDEYFCIGHDDSRWGDALLPNSFDAIASILDCYEGVVWFRRAFDVPREWQGKRVLLRFEGVNYHAKVWVNGQEAGEHQDGFLRFDFPIQDAIDFGGENVVAVRADNIRRDGEVPGVHRGWRTYGGILREVELIATDPLHLGDIRIIAEPVEQGGGLQVYADIQNERAETSDVELLVEIAGDDGKTIASFESQAVSLPAGEEGEQSFVGHVPDVGPWSPDTPNLYTAKLELRSDGQTVDEQTIRIGFRTVEAKDGKLLLNGRPIFLTGYNRHEDSPERNMATDLETARQDIIDMKAGGCNFVRLCHYPHHPGELDLCDELGILVMGEIPLYWWGGGNEAEDHSAAKLQAAKRQFTSMIRRDINHPSIIFWSASNETKEDLRAIASGNQELVRLAKELDSTRFAVHVSNHWEEYPNFAADDIICVNGYPTPQSRLKGGKLDYDLSRSTRFWNDHLQALHEKHPGKPILIAEFGNFSFEGVFGNGLGEDVQALILEAEFAGMQAPYICGATIWCWADHPWPPATFGFSHYMAISPFGVVSRDRHKLDAYHAAKRMFEKKHGKS
ncbi:MAG: glycoside hydrolase family 2 protein [Planctomycetes bacterium]|nr:glycoside hydrolase family 2 protein [Planctomycetota bacterium]